MMRMAPCAWRACQDGWVASCHRVSAYFHRYFQKKKNRPDSCRRGRVPRTLRGPLDLSTYWPTSAQLATATSVAFFQLYSWIHTLHTVYQIPTSMDRPPGLPILPSVYDNNRSQQDGTSDVRRSRLLVDDNRSQRAGTPDLRRSRRLVDDKRSQRAGTPNLRRSRRLVDDNRSQQAGTANVRRSRRFCGRLPVPIGWDLRRTTSTIFFTSNNNLIKSVRPVRILTMYSLPSMSIQFTRQAVTTRPRGQRQQGARETLWSVRMGLVRWA